MTTDEPVIVVVEDDPNIADLVDLYLRRAGFRVYQAVDGSRALDEICSSWPASTADSSRSIAAGPTSAS